MAGSTGELCLWKPSFPLAFNYVHPLLVIIGPPINACRLMVQSCRIDITDAIGRDCNFTLTVVLGTLLGYTNVRSRWFERFQYHCRVVLSPVDRRSYFKTISHGTSVHGLISADANL